MSDIENPWVVTPKKQEKEKKIVELIDEPKISELNLEFKPKYIIIALLLLWLVSGFYQVQPNEQAVVLRFGRYTQTVDAGLHYHLPTPIESIEKVNITSERSITLGVNNSNKSSKSSWTESHMLTGDENIVDINLTVVWKISSARDYLFSMKNPDSTVAIAAQSVLREIVGQSQMQDIITGDRGKVEEETKIELQKLLNEFGSGIEIIRIKLQKADPPKQVVDAFNEVQRAKADMERLKNEADAYRNEVLPVARGDAARILQSAEAYKEGAIKKAQGDADRFNAIYKAYQGGKEVTKKRLYLETMEEVLQNSDKTILEQNQALPLLNLNNQ
ncbi:MAG: FtsH protease activity modulator HflK [Alphaproteobacteria bacterium]